MKLLQWLSLPLAALYASAQGISIAAPANGTSIQAGSNFTVEIDQPVRVSQLRLKQNNAHNLSSTGHYIFVGQYRHRNRFRYLRSGFQLRRLLPS